MANVASGPANKVILGRLAANSAVRFGLKENLCELFKRGTRGAIRSGLLVEWESRGENFRRNLRDAMVSPFLIPVATGTSMAPEIWSKQTLLKRLQSLSPSRFPITSFYLRLL